VIDRFPNVRIREDNAAIGATGSELAVFRAQADLIDAGCDLVFVEFAVNDSGEESTKRARTREGLVRKLLAAGRDVVFTYTFAQGFYEEINQGKVPASIQEFENLAAHYGIGSVWMSLHTLNEVKRGFLRWEEWLPDGLHPQLRGSLSYGQSVIAFLEKELLTAPSPGALPVGDNLPAPLDPLNWEHGYAFPFAKVKRTGPWLDKRHLSMKWIDRILETAAPGAKLEFDFEGRVLTLGFDFGKNSSEFRYRLDGGDWTPVRRERPGWVGNDGWYRMTLISDKLPRRPYHFELEVTHGGQPDCTGTNFRLGLIGVVP
jgi:hypothetical protein